MTSQIVNPAGLAGMMAAARGGDVIRLAPGDYAAAKPKGAVFDFSPPLRLVADDPADPPRFFGQQTLTGWRGVIFEGMTFDRSNAEAPHSPAVKLTDCRDVQFLGGEVVGRLAEDGARWGYGIVQVAGVVGMVVQGVKLHRLRRGIVVSGGVDTTIADCDLTDLGTDGINGNEADGLVVARNHFSDFHPQAGDHSDAIQLATNAAGQGSTRVEIIDNLVECILPARFQGVLIGAQNKAARYRAVRIAANLLINTNLNGISVGATDDLELGGNIVLWQPSYGDRNKQSWIKAEASQGVVEGNAATMIDLTDGGAKGANTVIPPASDDEIRAAIDDWMARCRPPKPPPVSAQVVLLSEQLAETRAELDNARRTVAALQDRVEELAAERDEAGRSEANAWIRIADASALGRRIADMGRR